MADASSGVITVTTAGTAVAGPSTPGAAAVAVKAHPDNADTVWIGNDGSGDVSSSNGFPLDPGEGVVVPGDLEIWRFDADSSGDKFCWLVVTR